jgi:hypothetical protein
LASSKDKNVSNLAGAIYALSESFFLM